MRRPFEAGETAPAIDFDHVVFRYPTAAEISLASLESIALPGLSAPTPTPTCCAISASMLPRPS